MYYPYLRGKQYELILLRENASLLAENNIHPIIEPVRKDLKALKKACEILIQNEVQFTLIINPQVGELRNNADKLTKANIEELVGSYTEVSLGYILTSESLVSDLSSALTKFQDNRFSLIHDGFTEAQQLDEVLLNQASITRHIFIDERTSKLYRRHVRSENGIKVLVRDGFKQWKRNADYPESEHFSDLHLTFSEEGMDGFGDFLIVGNDYSESGGPAYAVAIHLTYIDSKKYEDMYISHFISDKIDSPTNPGGKFMEALKKLVDEIQKIDSKLFHSNALSEYQKLYKKEHFPGLGVVKKLSMQHHVELIADFISRN